MSPQKRKAVFLDRDGVLSRSFIIDGKPFAPRTYETFEVLPEAHDALARLKDAGYLLIVATNQPDVARGKMAQEVLDRMHIRLQHELPMIDGILSCCHDDSDGCHCRKPLPGMLTDAAAQWDIDLSQSYMIGDRWKDISMGQAAGCETIWIDYGYTEKSPEKYGFRAKNVAEAANWILDR